MITQWAITVSYPSMYSLLTLVLHLPLHLILLLQSPLSLAITLYFISHALDILPCLPCRCSVHNLCNYIDCKHAHWRLGSEHLNIREYIYLSFAVLMTSLGMIFFLTPFIYLQILWFHFLVACKWRLLVHFPASRPEWLYRNYFNYNTAWPIRSGFLLTNS